MLGGSQAFSGLLPHGRVLRRLRSRVPPRGRASEKGGYRHDDVVGSRQIPVSRPHRPLRRMARERDGEGRGPDLPASGRNGGEGLRAPQGPIPVPPQAEAQPTPVGSPENRPCPDPSPVGRASGRRAPAASLCERRVRATNRPCGRRPGRTPRRPPAAFQRRRQSPLPSPPDANSGNRGREQITIISTRVRGNPLTESLRIKAS